MKFELLLLDDDLVSTLITKKIIQSTGHFDVNTRIHTIIEAKKAIEFLEENKEYYKATALIILLDINMPVIDGFQVLDILSKSFSQENLHVFMLTSSISQEHKSKALSYSSVKGYFEKPITIKTTKELKNYIDKLEL